jgi:hypothetical protein
MSAGIGTIVPVWCFPFCQSAAASPEDHKSDAPVIFNPIPTSAVFLTNNGDSKDTSLLSPFSETRAMMYSLLQ